MNTCTRAGEEIPLVDCHRLLKKTLSLSLSLFLSLSLSRFVVAAEGFWMSKFLADDSPCALNSKQNVGNMMGTCFFSVSSRRVVYETS